VFLCILSNLDGLFLVQVPGAGCNFANNTPNVENLRHQSMAELSHLERYLTEMINSCGVLKMQMKDRGINSGEVLHFVSEAVTKQDYISGILMTLRSIESRVASLESR
jgi:hypothetical protein